MGWVGALGGLLSPWGAGAALLEGLELLLPHRGCSSRAFFLGQLLLSCTSSSPGSFSLVGKGNGTPVLSAIDSRFG